MIWVEQIPSKLEKFLKAWKKPLFLVKSAIMNLEMHYEKYAPFKLLLYYITITYQKSVFCTIFLTWDVLAGVKKFFAPFRWFWLVTMATGYLFDFFDIFKTTIMYTPYLDTRLVSQGLWTWEPFQNYWDKAPSGNVARKKALRSSVSHADIDYTKKNIISQKNTFYCADVIFGLIPC